MISQARGKSWSMIVAISHSQLIHLSAQQSTNNATSFCDFLDDLKAKLIRKMHVGPERIILFFDNASIHKTSQIKEKMAELFLRGFTNCPYSPELNAVELFINTYKQVLSKLLTDLK